MTKSILVSALPAFAFTALLTGCPGDTTETGSATNGETSTTDDSDSDTDTASSVTLSTTDSADSTDTDPTTTASTTMTTTDATTTDATTTDATTTDATTTDATTGGTSTGGTTDPTAGTGTTGVVPGDGYGDCANNPEAEVCQAGEVCLTAGTEAVCGLGGCMADGDCPVPATGDAAPICQDLSGMGDLFCILDCSAGQTCPDGMICDEGIGGVCIWELQAQGGGVCPDDSLAAAPTSYDGDNTGLFDDHIAGCGDGGGEEALLEFTADQDGVYIFDTFANPTFDTILFAIDGCDGPELACDDDSGADVQSQISVPMTMGQTIVIGVDGYGGATGTYTLTVTFVEPIDGGSCCMAQMGAGCDVMEVQDCVCAFDDFCCTDTWDDQCVGEAQNNCGAVCM